MTASATIRRFLLALGTTMIVATASLQAWGPSGHSGVGAIADQLLKQHPRAAAQVHAILGNISLEQAGPWGDCVRNVSGPPNFTYTHSPRYGAPCVGFEGPRLKAQMEDYVQNNWHNCSYRPEPGQPDEGCHSQYHFADVDLHHPGYPDHPDTTVGTPDYDIVHTINAAITVLQTPDCSSAHPSLTAVQTVGLFHFSCPQALMMLDHLIGDLHQPLHVGSIYLDENGARVDPDTFRDDRQRVVSVSTHGGNSLVWPDPTDPAHPFKLHSVWDGAPSMTLANAVAAARQVPPTTVPLGDWARSWADDTLIQAHAAFTGLTFGHKQGHSWAVSFTNQNTYTTDRRALQRQQIAKAGARLAQLLAAIWPG